MGLLIVSFATFWKSLETFKACPRTGVDGSGGVIPGKPTVGNRAASVLSCLWLSQLWGLVHCICRTRAGGQKSHTTYTFTWSAQLPRLTWAGLSLL